MLAKKYLKWLYYTSIWFMFMPAFVIFFVKNTNANVYFGFPFALVTMFCALFFCNYKKFFHRLLHISVIKYYTIFMLFIISTSFVHITLGFYKGPITFYIVRWLKFFISIVFVYLLPICSFLLNIKLRHFIKLYFTMILIVYLIGFIQYFTFLFNISFINILFYFFTNVRVSLSNFDLYGCQNSLRIFSIFSEPSSLGQFTFILLPIVNDLCKGNFKIYTNKYLNSFIKKFFIPLVLMNVVFTKSPIYLILCFTEFFILNIKHYVSMLKRYWNYSIIALSIIIPILPLLYYHFNDDFVCSIIIDRIMTTISCFGDFNKLVLLEPSLATRLVSYINQFLLFTKNIFFGVGLSNVQAGLNPYLLLSPVPLTQEAITGYYGHPMLSGVNPSVIWTSLAEFGIIGTLFYLLFVFKSFSVIKSIKKSFYGLENLFINGIQKTYITIFIISFYNLSMENMQMWFLYGISILLVFHYKYKRELLIKGKNE